MNRDEEHKYIHKETRARQARLLSRDLLAFQVDVIGQYYPGSAFWNFAVPGRTDAVQRYDFAEGYGGLIPAAYGDRVDNVLIEWITKQLSGEEARARIADVRAELQMFRDERNAQFGDRPRTEDEELFVVVADDLLESLGRLRDGVLPDEGHREAAAGMIQRFRDALLPGCSDRGDKLLGRG